MQSLSCKVENEESTGDLVSVRTKIPRYNPRYNPKYGELGSSMRNSWNAGSTIHLRSIGSRPSVPVREPAVGKRQFTSSNRWKLQMAILQIR